jgi:hypothetical protein
MIFFLSLGLDHLHFSRYENGMWDFWHSDVSWFIDNHLLTLIAKVRQMTVLMITGNRFLNKTNYDAFTISQIVGAHFTEQVQQLNSFDDMIKSLPSPSIAPFTQFLPSIFDFWGLTPSQPCFIVVGSNYPGLEFLSEGKQHCNNHMLWGMDGSFGEFLLASGLARPWDGNIRRACYFSLFSRFSWREVSTGFYNYT